MKINESQNLKSCRWSVFVSGAGTSLDAVATALSQGREKGHQEISLVLSNRPCGAEQVAQKHGIPFVVVDPKNFSDFEAWDQYLVAALKEHQIHSIFLMGFLKKVGPLVISEFKGRIFNTHPSLLPRHGGPGLYGKRVHEAVVQSGDLESGVSIHEVDQEYDTGAVVLQKTLTLNAGETALSLEARVRVLEKSALIEFFKNKSV